MSITTVIAGYIVNAIAEMGYLGIFVLMALESALVPIPSEIVMPFSGFLYTAGILDFWMVVVSGTLGNLAGSLASYHLGARLGRPFIYRYGKYLLISQQHLEDAQRLAEKYGLLSVFVGRLLPAIRTVISFPAGMFKVDPRWFIIYTLAGSFVWNMGLTYVGVVLGERWTLIERYGFYMDIAVITALITSATIYVYHTKRRGRPLQS